MRCRLVKPLARNSVAWLLLWVGVATSGLLGYLTARDLRSERQLVFQRNVDDTATAIEARLRAYTEVLHGVRGLFAGSGEVSAREFDSYVASLDLETRYPGIQALSFYPRVTRAQKEEFVRSARAMGREHARFSIEPPGERDEYYPIFYRARFIQDSPMLLGSDQMTEASRRAGIELARDSGTLAATAPLGNWNGKPSEIGVVMRLPLYRRDAPLSTLEERRKAAIGVVGAAFNVRDLIESVTRSTAAGQLRVRIHDAGRSGDAAGGQRPTKLLYADGDGEPRVMAAGLSPPQFLDPAREAVREIDVGGRRWRVSFAPGAEHLPFTAFNALPALVFAGGVIASMLLFALIRSLAQSGQRAQRLAESMMRKRMHAEAELQRLNSELEGRVESRTADLQAANRELEAFSYSVSHDLRAPVRHIAGYLSMLQHQAAQRLTDGDRRYLGKAATAASRMGRLIDDLLAFSRTSRTALRMESVDMDGAAGRALEELAPEMAKREIEVVAAPLPPARADGAFLHLVWINLLSNAVKYTASRAGARIEIGTLAGRDDENVYFVRDNGVGFDMEHAHKLFGVFQRLHSQAEFEGTGIGLAIVQRVISRHGGRAWAEGSPGGGAMFCFALPHAARGVATESAA